MSGQPYPGDRIRNVRVPDELWEAAKSKAAAEGRSVSEVVRDYLKRWVAQPGK
jgi:hypothetical protein